MAGASSSAIFMLYMPHLHLSFPHRRPFKPGHQLWCTDIVIAISLFQCIALRHHLPTCGYRVGWKGVAGGYCRGHLETVSPGNSTAGSKANETFLISGMCIL